MALIPLDQVKLHLRVDSDHEDALIQMYLQGAETRAAQFLNRNVYADQAALDAAVAADTAGDHPIVADDMIRCAVLLTVGHLYANREDVVTGVSVAKVPVGAEYLLLPYRACMGV